jgi:hypothetical protein
MTLAEIRDRYKGRWVLIEFRELDGNLEVVDGDVVAVADSKEQIYAKQLTIEGKNLAIEYCGEWPTDLAVMLWLPVTRGSDTAGCCCARPSLLAHAGHETYRC